MLVSIQEHSKWCMLSHFGHVQLFGTPRAVAYQAHMSMGFSGQEYQSGLPCPPPGDLPNPGFEPASLTSPTLAGRFFNSSTTWATTVVVVQSISHVQLLQPMDCILPGSSAHGILWARILEWVVISFSNYHCGW